MSKKDPFKKNDKTFFIKSCFRDLTRKLLNQVDDKLVENLKMLHEFTHNNVSLHDGSGKIDIGSVQIVKTTQPKGRPKGKTCNVIGIKIEKGIVFSKMSLDGKRKLLLKWLMPHENVNQFLGPLKIIPSEFVLTLTPNSLPDSFADKLVDLALIKNYFANDEDYQSVIDVLQKKKDANFFSCGICQKQVGEEDKAVCCDACLIWSHMTCIAKNNAPKVSQDYWFCKKNELCTP